MYKSSDKRYTVPMKNAEASVRMEGCQVTPQMREQCQRVLRGEVTTAELPRRFLPSFPGVEVYPPCGGNPAADAKRKNASALA